MVLKKTKENPLVWLYITPKDNLESLIKAVDSILIRLGYEIRTLVLSSKNNLLDVLESRDIRNFTYDKKDLGEGIYSFSLSKKIRGTKKKRKSRFIIFKHPNPDIYILITHEKYTHFHKDILSFFNKHYPKIVKNYIDSKNMEEIFHNLEKEIEEINIRVKVLSTQSRITNKEANKPYESGRKWTDISFKEMFQKVEENDEWIKSIDFTFASGESTISDRFKDFLNITCQISRNGVIKCDGKYAFFYSIIVNYLIKKAIEDLNLLSNRQRIKEEKFKPKPIVIEYNFDLFKDISQNKRLIEVLQKIPFSSLSVSHSNPYLNCSYVDFKDGSSYDIWILSNNEITIIPQMRSSYASLEKLSHHIFIGLREGLIKNYSV